MKHNLLHSIDGGQNSPLARREVVWYSVRSDKYNKQAQWTMLCSSLFWGTVIGLTIFHAYLNELPYWFAVAFCIPGVVSLWTLFALRREVDPKGWRIHTKAESLELESPEGERILGTVQRFGTYNWINFMWNGKKRSFDTNCFVEVDAPQEPLP